MKTKLIEIKGCKTAEQVLIYMDTDANGKLFVNIQCWHTQDEIDYEQIENIEMPNTLMAERFVCDFSEMSANEYANAYIF